jgi:hypothetical protein
MLRLAPAVSVPGGLFHSDVVLDNAELARLWTPADAPGLTQEAARYRIVKQRNWTHLWLALGAMLTVLAVAAALGFYFYQTAFHRPFRPRLEWSPAGEIVIDFNRQSGSCLLLGTLRVVNPEPVPWFGSRLKHTEQPTRQAVLRLAAQGFETMGLVLAAETGPPVGFLSGGVGETRLCVETEEAVSDGKRIYLFMAGEAIRDLDAVAASRLPGEFACDVSLPVRIEWQGREGRPPEAAFAAADVAFSLRVKPEEPREPRVTFEPAGAELFFRQGESLDAGRFLFVSRADHAFARAFAGEYLLRASRDSVPLAGDPVHLATPRVVLAAQARQAVPVRLLCDGGIVVNPEPESQGYEFRLVGPQTADSSPGPHAVTLYRDPTRAEIVLQVGYLGKMREIFWTEEGAIRQRPLDAEQGEDSVGEPVGSEIRFQEPFALAFGEANPPVDLLALRVGNSARSGKGVVEVGVSPRLAFTGDTATMVHPLSGHRLEDVLRLYRLSEPLDTDLRPQFRIKEGDEPRALDLRLEPAHIESIDGARIPAEQCRAEVDLDILVRDDRGEETRRTLRLSVPLELERLPGPNWLAIDFGTSAIAAALGSAIDDRFTTIRLQDVPVRMDDSTMTYGLEDPANPEFGTPFLPSWVICDADLRQDKSDAGRNGWRPGFPVFHPASLRPGDPSFVGLPAMTFKVAGSSGRVIVSLKSWLGKGGREIRLQEAARYLGRRGEVQNRLLPLDAVVESGFAALAQTYLHEVHPEQIVICHPNTFTARHRERLHAIAANALMKPFDLAAPRHIHLISESDAVAYFYCSQRMRREPRSGRECLLVYDFGAGTLDISIIQIEWHREPCYPMTWRVEERIGVPVAGNHLDEVLARIVDEQLRNPEVLGPKLTYRIPVVAGASPEGVPAADFRSAIYDFHTAIKKAKHTWDGGSPFVIVVGNAQHALGTVSYSSTAAGAVPTIDPGSPSVGIQGDAIELSIPAQAIYGHPLMVELLQFVTETVVDEALASADLKAEDVDTLIVSGRGARWPGLKEALNRRLPRATAPEWLWSEVGVKEAVVRGAIARQSLLIDATEAPAVTRGKRLGVLLPKGGELIPEERWDRQHPIDLTADAAFRLVQVGLRVADPRRDMSTLRQHFYIDLAGQTYQRDTLWKGEPKLIVEKAVEHGRTVVRLKNTRGQSITVGEETGASGAMTPPWPIGSLLLHPLD